MKTLVTGIALLIAFTAHHSTFAQEKGKGKEKQELKMKEKKGGKDKSDKGPKVKKEKAHGPPSWAPAHGYRKRFVYFPKQETYYDNQKGVYISKDKEDPKKWNVSVKVPEILKDIDLSKETKVEIDHEGEAPQDNHGDTQKKFPVNFKLGNASPGN